ncbi:uncharacterized protein TRIADDRAFT_51541 [Trichoplax adhaerens]|uniref:Uncharacterized protein n=1 Tax=Trichoplax adhaerens TaxID=10228 RepID=B3RJP7_TRIAD|nr:hypothetical protein TRIADDRAFT_51541 [Trichoplax adhaerens]EDV29331.1 hypothetical protein TRIADDRAFT_51541 [Trichoplax adhaerens]|eukprot:XP_002108533.1 hypothetical protein TRIADDRAFT_51541 [Trichoplax adhaerens]
MASLIWKIASKFSTPIKTLPRLTLPMQYRCFNINVILCNEFSDDIFINNVLEKTGLQLKKSVAKKLLASGSREWSLDYTCDSIQCLQSFGFQTAGLNKIFTMWPFIVVMEKKLLIERIEFWGKEYLDMDWVRSTAVKFPRLLAYDVKSNILPKIHYLYHFFKNDAAVKQIIRKYPYFLISRKGTIEERINCIAEIGMNPATVLTLIKRQPRLLYATSSGFSFKIVWLERLGFDRSEIVSLLLRYPSIFVTNINKLEEKVHWLVEVGYGGGSPRRIIWINPPCLGYTVKSMKIKFALLRDHLKIDLEQIHNCPSALGYSTKRLYNRIAYLKHLRLWEGPYQPSLGSFITKNDQDFCNLVAKRPYQHYMNFVDSLPADELTEKLSNTSI